MSKIPYPLLVVAAVLLAAAPLGQEPHLIEKLRMLTAGELQRPIDIFDLLLHGTPLLLLLVKVAGDLRKGRDSNHLALAGLRQRYPGEGERDLLARLARMRLGEELYDRAYGKAETS